MSNIQGLSLFDPARFDIHHGFTISMASQGGRPFSMTGYTSHISYWASDNLALNAKIMLFNTMGPFARENVGSMQNLQLAYDAGITFKPTENSFVRFELRSHNSPYYQNSNYNLNRLGHSPNQRNSFYFSPGPRIQD